MVPPMLIHYVTWTFNAPENGVFISKDILEAPVAKVCAGRSNWSNGTARPIGIAQPAVIDDEPQALQLRQVNFTLGCRGIGECLSYLWVDLEFPQS